MPRFRKKPVEVEAMQFTDGSAQRIVSWVRSCGGSAEHGARLHGTGYRPTIRIQTLEGAMAANLGDWVIRGVKGEFYPCKPDIFEATYEAVPEAPVEGAR